jgi:CRISPR-associated protein Cas1
MGTLYIVRKDLFLKLEGNAISIYYNGKKEGSIPLNPVKRIIVSSNIIFETRLIKRLVDNNITVIFLSGKNMRFCGILRGRLHNNGLLRVQQYKSYLDEEFRINFSKELILRKLQRHKELLEEWQYLNHQSISLAIKTIEEITKSLNSFTYSIETIRGMEGGAASAFFSAYILLFDKKLNFCNRNRRPPLDPVNAILSLCYTLVHYEVVREIEIAGLDPTIGFYHEFEYGRESLACDIVELFRPCVEEFVFRTFNEKNFTEDDFINNDKKAGCYLKKESREKFYFTYEEWIKNLRPLIRNEVREIARRLIGEEKSLPE